MHNLLITGGAGFVGSNFVRYLLRNAPQVRLWNLDALTYAGSPENLRDLPDPGRHVFIQGDICDEALVAGLLREHTVDTIVHFAAESHVDRSILGPGPFIRTNIVGTFTLLEAARQAWKDRAGVRFHHVSTDEVYGSLGPKDAPFTEKSPYDPHSPYSASKAAADHLVRAYFRTYNLPVTLTNCSNNYGPYQFPEKLIPLTILNALQGKPIPIYGDGRQVRDWLFVEDHCEAIHRVLQDGKAGETYNVGGESALANFDVVRAVCAILDDLRPESAPHARLMKFIPDRPGHDRRYRMDTSRLRGELGWKPRHDIQSGLWETVQWYLAHPDWTEAILARDDYREWLERNYAAGAGGDS